MGGSSKKQTVGYRYYLGMHKILCHGPVDYIIEIKVDQRLAWSGRTKQGALNINKPSLFGGESREGGVSGTVDFESGGPTQGANSYLVNKLSSLVPAFRGVAGVVLRQVYVGMNPYLKKWSFRLKRIHVRQNGLKQWYSTKAEINGDVFTADASEYSNIYSGATLNSVDFNGNAWLTAGENASLRRSSNGGESWQNTAGASGSSFKEIASNADGIFIATTSDFSAVQRSASNGEGFSLVSIPSIEPGNVRPNCVCWGNVSDTFMVGCDYAGFGYVAVSQNGGISWTNVPYPGANYSIGSSPTSLVWAGGNRFLASTTSGYIYKSDNIGFTWEVTEKRFVDKLFKTPFNILGITQTDSITRTNDGGVTWTNSAPLPFTPKAITNLGDLLVCVGVGGKIALSYDYGDTWEQLPQTLAGGANLLDIKSNGDNLVYAVGTGGIATRIKIVPARKGDMNPAHIVRECLTDPDWGMGYSEDEIDDVSFKAAADTLFQENFGISILWDRQMPIEQFITEILKHIDAALYVNRQTGLFTIKLIRGDYNESSLLHLNESNIERIDNFTRTSLGELTNSVTVNYWNSDTGNGASITVQDIALVQLQQATINTTLQYPGITDSGLASRVAQRSLKSLSTPRVSCTIYTNRTAKNLAIGDVFKLSWSDYEVSEMVMRVTEMAYGDGRNHKIRITCTQDTFDLPNTEYVTPGAPEWVDPIQEPQPVTNQISFEVPYRELVQIMGQATIDSLLSSGPEIGFAAVSIARPEGTAINARMYVNAGAGFDDVAGVEFSPVAELAIDVDEFATVFSLVNWEDSSLVQDSTWAQIGDELVFITAITGTSITVKRAILDTIPRKHFSGSKIFFWDAFSAGDQTEYVAGESLGIRVTPVSGGGQVDLADATEMTLEMEGRANRPYRPGDLQGNGEYQPGVETEVVYPVVITWKHRNRLQDTASEPVGYYEGSVTSEPGVTYTLSVTEINNDGSMGSVLHTETGLTGETWDLPFSVVSLSSAPAFLVTVKSVRDGVESWRKSEMTILANLEPPTGLSATPEEY